MEKSKNRILWVDASRGIAMLLVILGHCIGSLNDPGYKFILSFHMPLFSSYPDIVQKRKSNSGLI